MEPETIAPSSAENSGSSASLALNWATIGRIFIKAAVLFIVLNLIFSALQPVDRLGRLSIYNALVRGRERLPYGEVPAKDYNLTLNNLAAMFASHELSRPKRADEYRVLVMGDSGIWGWLLGNEQTLVGQLNAMNLHTADGRSIIAYNLGYPVMSLMKDLVLLDEAMAYEPDMILWPVTLQSFARNRQLDHPLLQNNAGRVRELIDRFELNIETGDERLVERSFLEETIIGRRHDLADLVRLQGYGFAWAATGIDQAIPDEINLRAVNLDDDPGWLDISTPRTISDEDLSFDMLAAGIERSGEVPVLIINEPMFISDGANSDIRYNTFYPRWAYDQYRQRLAEKASSNKWRYLDLWDAIPANEFTDTPVHLTPTGSRLLAELVAPHLIGDDHK